MTRAELEARACVLAAWLREGARMCDRLDDDCLARLPATGSYLGDLPGALLDLVDALYRARARQRKRARKTQRRR